MNAQANQSTALATCLKANTGRGWLPKPREMDALQELFAVAN